MINLGVLEKKESASVPSNPFDNNRVLYLKYNDVSGTSVSDSSNDNNDALIYENGYTWGVQGVKDTALQLKSGAHIRVEHNSNFNQVDGDTNRPFSGSFFYKPTGSDPNKNVWHIAKRRLGTYGWQVIYYNGNFRIDIYNTSNGIMYSGSFALNLTLNEFTHFGFSVNPETEFVKFYIDGFFLGESKGTFSDTLATNSEPLYVGKFGGNGSMDADGVYDEMSIWTNRVISEEEFESLFNNPR